MGNSDIPDDVRSFVFTADCVPAIYITRMLLTGNRCGAHGNVNTMAMGEYLHHRLCDHDHPFLPHSNILIAGPTGTGKTALANAILASASDWMVSPDRVREVYAKKVAQEAADEGDDDGGDGGPTTVLSSNTAQAGGLPGNKSVAILLQRLASSRRFTGQGASHISPSCVCHWSLALTVSIRCAGR